MKSYLILGATGTLGRAMTAELLKNSATKTIVCLSRDELKLSQLRTDPKIETVIADIRDKSSIRPYFKGIDTVFHFAALKRIPEMEKFPLESLKTNINGTVNAAECAMEFGVRNFVFSSTDKACMPINSYGASKFLAEKILLHFNRAKITNFSIYRWGNVMGSRGSVVYAFRDSLLSQMGAQITDEAMTRFWIRIEDAIKFVLSTYEEQDDKVRFPKMKSAKVLDVLAAVAKKIGKEPKHILIGTRPGEKTHEHISFERGADYTSNTAEKYSESELFDLIGEVE